MRITPRREVRSMTTIDLAARFRPTGRGLLAGLDITASVQNLFNQPPPPIAVTTIYDAPFDSTNATAIGRFVSLSVSRKW